MPPGPIRIFLLDNERLTRSLLEHALADEPGFVVVATAADAPEAHALLHETIQPVDVAIVDLALPGDAAIDLMPAFHARFPQCRIVALDPAPSRGRRSALAVSSGAAVSLTVEAGLPDLIDAVRKAHHGESLIAPNELHVLLRDATRWRASAEQARALFKKLTPREIDILRELATGRSDKEIAEGLHIKLKTVGTHVTHLLGKLDVDSRLQAVLLAIRHDFVDIGRD